MEEGTRLNSNSVLRMEISIGAQHLMQQFMFQNELVEKELEAGMEQAIKDFDFKQAAYDAMTKALRESVWSQDAMANARRKVSEMMAQTMDDQINAVVENMKDSFKKQP